MGFATRDAAADRVVLIGDAAGQIEPMTGQGIFLALRSAVLAADVAATALNIDDLSAHRLSQYARQHRREITGKLSVARCLQRLAFYPQLTPALVRRLGLRPALAADLLGATSDVVPPGPLFSPASLLRLIV